MTFAQDIDRDELAVRLMERAVEGFERPRHITEDVTQIMDAAALAWPEHYGPFPFRDMADIAISYVEECVRAGQRTRWRKLASEPGAKQPHDAAEVPK